jgi:hypothetical protein
MSVDAFPIVLADQVVASMPCQNSLTDEQIRVARTALRHLAPTWSLECLESCEADLFLDLCATHSDGTCVSYIIHAEAGALHVLRMFGDDDLRLGQFDDIAAALQAVIAAIEGHPSAGLTDR